MLHEELRSARERAGMSQAQLAERAGIPRNQIVRAEKGENITLDTLRKIAAYLPITELTLLDRVKLTTDILPVHDKIYVGAMETLAHLLGTLEVAVNHAQSTWSELAKAEQQETPEERAEHAPAVDPTLLFQRMQHSLKAVEQIKRTA